MSHVQTNTYHNLRSAVCVLEAPWLERLTVPQVVLEPIPAGALKLFEFDKDNESSVLYICEQFDNFLAFILPLLGRSWSAARKGGGGERERKPDGEGGDGWTTVGGGR